MNADPRDFLSRVLAWPKDEDAPGFVNMHWTIPGKTGKPFWLGKPTRKLSDFVGLVNWAQSKPTTRDIYMCMSTQKAVKFNAKGNAQAERTQANAVALKAIWIDLDVKPPPKGYKDVTAAVTALTKFVDEAKLPPPSALIGSGGGVHVYWISDRALTPAEWQPYANGLKALILQHGLLCDAGCTTDSARVLRVPGTKNHKTNPPRPVLTLTDRGPDYHFEKTLGWLRDVAPVATVAAGSALGDLIDPGVLGTPRPTIFAAELPSGENLATGVRDPLPPINPTRAIKECGFLRDAAMTGGRDYTQPMWNLSTLAAIFMEAGNDFAHAFGNKHAGYSFQTTEDLWARKQKERKEKGLGFPSCDAIRTAGCTACAVCPHLGKIKSPLNLVDDPPPVQANTAAPVSNTSVTAPVVWPDGVKKDGLPIKGYANTLAAFGQLGIEFTYDVFRQKEFTTGHNIKMLNGEVSDRVVTMVRDRISKEYGFYPDKEMVREAITAECTRNQVNPVIDYFGQLRWDGTPRLSKLLHKYLGADDTPLNDAIGVKLLCAIVRRVKKPGCKFDHEVVLQGGQGVRKSMFCEDLAVFPDLFTDAGDFGASMKELMEVTQGKQILECPELAGLSHNSRERRKAQSSRRVDRARMAYAHYASDQPRCWVRIGTTNPGGYLNDPTGERRYWHVAVVKYDRDAFLRDKDQLYAEAVAREPTEKLWLDTPDLVSAHDAIVATAKEPNALVEHLADLCGEPWETRRDKVERGWLIQREERVSNAQVRAKLGIFGVDVVRMKDLGKRVSDAMMTLGWKKVDGTLVCKHGGQAEGGYRRSLPDTFEPDAEPAQEASPPIAPDGSQPA